jgi:hypothetical protein
MNYSGKSPFITFLKIVFCGVLIFAAYVVGDNLGYKRGYQETVNFTLGKLGIEKPVADYTGYGTALDEYRAGSRSIDKNIENILSTEKLGEMAGSLVTKFINGLIGK